MMPPNTQTRPAPPHQTKAGDIGAELLMLPEPGSTVPPQPGSGPTLLPQPGSAPPTISTPRPGSGPISSPARIAPPWGSGSARPSLATQAPSWSNPGVTPPGPDPLQGVRGGREIRSHSGSPPPAFTPEGGESGLTPGKGVAPIRRPSGAPYLAVGPPRSRGPGLEPGLEQEQKLSAPRCWRRRRRGGAGVGAGLGAGGGVWEGAEGAIRRGWAGWVGWEGSWGRTGL